MKVIVGKETVFTDGAKWVRSSTVRQQWASRERYSYEMHLEDEEKEPELHVMERWMLRREVIQRQGQPQDKKMQLCKGRQHTAHRPVLACRATGSPALGAGGFCLFLLP